MITLLAPGYELQPVTEDDIALASLAWGFTLGFGFLTVWTAIKQTRHVSKKHGASRLNTPYIWMIWGEIAVCLSFSIICWLHLRGDIPPSFAFYFCILTTWALQVQFLLQIIINRVSVLLVNRKKGLHIKIGVAILITAINISVYCIWIPARLQVSEAYIHLNDIWDRCEKVIYLIVDASLNWYFIYIVQKNLVRQGLKKYESLVKFNIYIIGFSLSMDILIISMMSLKNSFVYMQFHPLAYIVKLKIEMSMADLIATVSSSSSNTGGFDTNRRFSNRTRSGSASKQAAIQAAFAGRTGSVTSSDAEAMDKKHHDCGDDEVELKNIMRSGGVGMPTPKNLHSTTGIDHSYQQREGPLIVHQQQEISVEVESVSCSVSGAPSLGGDDSDTRPLRTMSANMPGVKPKSGFGMHTKVWGGGNREE
ncbi:hypothetical protein BFW01_g9223 [Lasiodiplodia theobromae]|uniref:Satratoxin biosynthesis SC1 cluster protein 4 n=1 Tax=Lasiodiplodia theobromae TaxID=45133 RepID=A0A5N5D9U9_9PEZI|nr:uncharacterized protein LTHEOB_10229 [Lasiodiplodia theobromae]KAB2574375.1 hypothetical protein DBV05_g6954 [Lasiodiplodia theobromae]KAF4539297.1 hypothetical protein LTHEOB_10229 [Lasiodiplodia theobromae]KAF9638326.1 hypothetical protein BFW01_g9223 [Lasiodiplodia theobromae]